MTTTQSQTNSSISKKKPKRRSRTRRQTKNPDVHAKIDAFMAAPVPTTEGSVKQRPTGLEVILHHLWTQSMNGSRKAEKLFWRYIRFYQNNGRHRRNPFILLYGPDHLTYEEVMIKRRRAA